MAARKDFSGLFEKETPASELLATKKQKRAGKGTKTARFELRLTPTVRDMLREIAQAEGLSMNSCVAQLIIHAHRKLKKEIAKEKKQQ